MKNMEGHMDESTSHLVDAIAELESAILAAAIMQEAARLASLGETPGPITSAHIKKAKEAIKRSREALKER